MNSRWPLERVLFLMAGTMTLLSILLAVFISPWFLIIAGIVAVSQWSYVAFGDCPSSLVLRRMFGLQGCAR